MGEQSGVTAEEPWKIFDVMIIIQPLEEKRTLKAEGVANTNILRQEQVWYV